MHYSCAPSLSFDVNLVCGCGQNKTLKKCCFNYQLKRYKNRKVYNFVERKTRPIKGGILKKKKSAMNRPEIQLISTPNLHEF